MNNQRNIGLSETQICAQCGLPYGKGGVTSQVDGKPLHFCCYGCSFTSTLTGEQGDAGTAGLFLARLGFAAFLSMNIMAVSWMTYDKGWATFGLEPEALLYLEKLLFVLSIPIMLFVGTPYLRNGWRELPSFRFSTDSLIALGSFTAFGVSSYQVFTGGGGIYFDTATTTLVLVTAGRYIEATAKVRTSNAIRKLIDLQPETARVVHNGRESIVLSKEVDVGEQIKVLPGERMPLDGVVEEGRTSINEAILTGESVPAAKHPGSRVFAATINIDGAIVVNVTARQRECVHAQIVRLMEEAQRTRSPIQQTVDRISGIFIPAVIGIAALTFAGWMIAAPFEEALLHALTVLVVACPCALGIGAPLASAIGIGHAAEQGVLIRSTEAMENVAHTKLVAFDKTGTLTRGEPSVSTVWASGDVRMMLSMGASVGKNSEHSLSKALVRYAEELQLPFLAVSDVRVIPGLGVAGNVEVHGKWLNVVVGNEELMIQQNIVLREELPAIDGTCVYVGWDGALQGSIGLRDSLRRLAAETVAELHAMKLETYLLSGDSNGATQSVAAAVGIEAAFAKLLPDGKLGKIRSLSSAGALMMVGDGINDAPSLAAADIGVTLGSATDIAKESADVTIIGDHLEKIPWLIHFSRRVLSTIRWNLVWAFGYNAVGIAFAVAGLLEPILAAIAMVVSSLFIIVNSRRLARSVKPGLS